jgi:chlorite dismutase
MKLDINHSKATKSIDLGEKGKAEDGTNLFLDRRLYMQLLVFGNVIKTGDLIKALEESDISGILYEDINDPFGIGILTLNENPDYFLTEVRKLFRKEHLKSLQPKPEYTMLGRTYSIGYEKDLEQVLIQKPINRITDPDLPWVIWYPVRRSGAFEQLPIDEQKTILMEHGGIGRAYGEAGLAYDIRLACYGFDKNDNDFVIGLLGNQLHPLSRIVERMRKTKQTSLYLENLGPFFIGKKIWANRNLQN